MQNWNYQPEINMPILISEVLLVSADRVFSLVSVEPILKIFFLSNLLKAPIAFLPFFFKFAAVTIIPISY